MPPSIKQQQDDDVDDDSDSDQSERADQLLMTEDDHDLDVHTQVQSQMEESLRVMMDHSQVSHATSENHEAHFRNSLVLSCDTSDEEDDSDEEEEEEERDDDSNAVLYQLDRNQFAFGKFHTMDNCENRELTELCCLLAQGQYADALRGVTAQRFFSTIQVPDDATNNTTTTKPPRVAQLIQDMVARHAHSTLVDCLLLELLGVAALNLFLQLNYTGPSLFDDADDGLVDPKDPFHNIYPHDCFVNLLGTPPPPPSTDATTTHYFTGKFHNAVLAELAVDGEWPCQVCQGPYFLLLARSLLLGVVATTNNIHDKNNTAVAVHKDWTCAYNSNDTTTTTTTPTATSTNPPPPSSSKQTPLLGATVWSARAAVAHARLVPSTEPPPTLWHELQTAFSQHILPAYTTNIHDDDNNNNHNHKTHAAATMYLEWGLAQVHLQRPTQEARHAFVQAQHASGLHVTVTGAKGKRTKFQNRDIAQMLVEAESSNTNKNNNNNNNTDTNDNNNQKTIEAQQVPHDQDEILLERIHFQDNSKNQIPSLTVLDQAILLALCLDVKCSHPTGDELTAEEMGAYLARVLDHHDDWMLYSTALLERAWLEFTKVHGRERAILQVQALLDQQTTNRLTITQSTKQSLAESAPVQDRLEHLHVIVYPPRWAMMKDLADRYAHLGILVSAAELYTQIELWDEVVECYRRAGRESQAHAIVRERLAVQETPRMWNALGDLTQDPQYYEKAVEVSHGRFSNAYASLGLYYFDKGQLALALENYQKALAVRPVAPALWFRLGTISMQLGKWEEALQAFSRVVQLEPEEHEAWANVAAVHMHNQNAAEAYPALVESLKHDRNNWRIWSSKLYVCLDLQKYDEAVQACSVLLDLQASKGAADKVPPLEEKCVRAIVGGAVEALETARGQNDQAAMDSARRTISRVNNLLDRIKSASNPGPWLFETMAFFHESIGGEESKEVLNNLMKEYRALQSVTGWERDDPQVEKVCQVVTQVVQIQIRGGSKDGIAKSRFLVNGVLKRVRKSRADEAKVPECIARLEALLQQIQTDSA